MQIIQSLLRIIKYSVQHVTRNASQSVLFILVFTLTLLFAQLFAVSLIASEQVLIYLENQPQVLVFFKDEAQPDQLQQIKTELEKDELIESVTYISKEQAVEIYRDLHKDQPELLEFVTPEILPASLEISGNDISYLSTIATQFQENQFVEQVIFQRDLVQEVLGLTSAARAAGLVVVGVLSLITLMIILMVVTQNLNAFAREIEIMRLVGASAGYIAMPFLIDALLFSFVAVLLATFSTSRLLPSMNEFVNTFIAPVGDFVINSSYSFESIVGSDLLAQFSSDGLLLLHFGVITFVVSLLLTALTTGFIVLDKLRI